MSKRQPDPVIDLGRPTLSSGALVGRLLKGGLPAIAASAFVAFVPIIGSAYLDIDQYAVWALAATLSTIFIVFDFGTPTLATKLAGSGHLDFRTVLSLCGLSALPPIVLGSLAVAAWPTYSSAADLNIDDTTAINLILAVSVGGIFRSMGIVYGAAALGRSHFAKRTAILFLGGSIQLAATVIALELGFGVISLGVGTIAAGLTQFVIGYLVEGRVRQNDKRLGDVVSVSVKKMIILFMRTRFFVAMLGLWITQLDRWALGLVGDPALLAQYDIAIRFIMIPKIIMIALSAGLVADSSRLVSEVQGRQLLTRVQKLVSLAVVPLLVLTAALAFFAQKWAGAVEPSLLILALVAVAHGTNCLTIGPANILAGIGRPDFELRYLVPLAIVAAIAYVLGIASEDGYVFISVWAGAMAVLSAWFAASSNRYVREVFR